MRALIQRATILITGVVATVWIVCAVFLSEYGLRYWWAISMLAKATPANQPVYQGLVHASMFHIQQDWATPTILSSLLLMAVLLLNLVVFVWRTNRALN